MYFPENIMLVSCEVPFCFVFVCVCVSSGTREIYRYVSVLYSQVPYPYMVERPVAMSNSYGSFMSLLHNIYRFGVDIDVLGMPVQNTIRLYCSINLVNALFT